MSMKDEELRALSKIRMACLSKRIQSVLGEFLKMTI